MTGEAVKKRARALRRGVEVALIERRYRLPAEAARTAEAAPGDHLNAYAPTPWRLLRRMLPPSEVTDTDVFLDVGCGYGRVVLEAAEQYPFARVIGVEVDPALAEAARNALEGNADRLRCRDWEIVTADARRYDVPDDVTIAYLFDPFTGAAFDAAIARLIESQQRRARTIRLVYLVPKERARLPAKATPVRSGTGGWLRTSGRYEYLVADLVP